MLDKEKLIDYLHHCNLLFDSEIDDSPDSRTYYESTAKRNECWDLIKVIQSGKFYMKDKKCAWEYQDELPNGQHDWETQCNENMQFEERNFDNRFRYCPFCGGEIEMKK